jgi:hypothetical protein
MYLFVCSASVDAAVLRNSGLSLVWTDPNSICDQAFSFWSLSRISRKAAGEGD